MRNLKRTLSLALAAVMLMGMMVVGAGAASKDFTDASDIKNVEAVDVMVALGILEGGDKGDFQPNSILTREQAAKIICYMLLGEDSAEKLSTNSAVFNDVAADRWSAPYIGYCVNLGILAGDGQGNFFPEGKLTGAAFAKMLLVALGYDPAIEEYVGNSWTINVAADAIEAGISPKGVVLTNELSRQDAAQMAFQTLTATVVKYDNKGTTVIGSDGMQVIVGASSASAVANNNSNYDSTSTDDKVMQFCEKYFSDLTKVAGDADAFGRPADYQWQLDGDEVYNATLTPDQTYTTATKGGDIYKDLGKPSGATYTYYVDGKDVTSSITSYYTGFAIASGDSDKIGGKGSVVEVFETADDEYTVTVTNTFVGEVSDWNEADEDKDVEESIDISALTQPADVAGASGTLNANFETVAFDESDVDDETVVLFTAAWDDDNNEYVIKSASVAEKVEDLELTSTTGTTKFVAGGTTYEYGTVNYSESVVLKDSINVYLDTYGYVVYVEKYQAGSSNYAFVLDAKANEKEWTSDDTTYTAKLLLTDGTVVTVNTDDQDSTTLTSKYVSYTVDDDDVYTLTAKDSTSAAGASIDVTKGTSKFTVGTDTYYANSSTIFLVYDNTNEEYAVYTGMANVPTMEGTATVYVNTKNGTVGSVASIVYISAADTVVSDANKGLVYIIAGSESALVNDADKGEYYTYDAVIDGEITTVDVAKAAKLSGDVLASKLTYNSKDVVTNITDYSTTGDDKMITGTGTLKTTDGTVGLNGAYYTYASDVVVYKVEDDEFSKVNVTSIRDDVDDTYMAVLKDGEITAIFITVVE